MSPMRRKPPWEMDLVELLEDRDESPPSDEELEEFEQIVEEYERSQYDYELIPDRVVSLDKKKYATRAEAYSRFAEIAASQGLMQIGHKETARHYVWECLYEKRQNKSS